MRLKHGLILVAAAIIVVPILVGGYFAVAAVTARIPLNGAHSPPADGIRIGLMSNGAHANLHLPVVTDHKDWRTVFPPARFARTPYPLDTIAFGWGHREFYLTTPTWADLDPLVGLRAIFGIGPSALHVSYWPPVADGPRYVEVAVSAEAYRVLVDHVLATIDPGPDGRPQLVPHELYSGYDLFFEAHGRYSFVNTCNEWVQEGLAAAGLPTPLWSPLPGPLLAHLRRDDGA